MNMTDFLLMLASFFGVCVALWLISLTGDHGPATEEELQDRTW